MLLMLDARVVRGGTIRSGARMKRIGMGGIPMALVSARSSLVHEVLRVCAVMVV